MPKRRFGALFRSTLVIGAACAATPSVAGAQEYAQVFPSVVDGNGAPVLNLTADDFTFKIGDEAIELAGADYLLVVCPTRRAAVRRR